MLLSDRFQFIDNDIDSNISREEVIERVIQIHKKLIDRDFVYLYISNPDLNTMAQVQFSSKLFSGLFHCPDGAWSPIGDNSLEEEICFEYGSNLGILIPETTVSWESGLLILKEFLELASFKVAKMIEYDRIVIHPR